MFEVFVQTVSSVCAKCGAPSEDVRQNLCKCAQNQKKLELPSSFFSLRTPILVRFASLLVKVGWIRAHLGLSDFFAVVFLPYSTMAGLWTKLGSVMAECAKKKGEKKKVSGLFFPSLA